LFPYKLNGFDFQEVKNKLSGFVCKLYLWRENRIHLFMKNTQAQFVLLILGIFFLGLSLVLLSFNKESIHLSVNAWNGSGRDVFFYYLTMLGDGLFALLVMVLAIFFRFRYAIAVGISFLSSALIVQALKHLVFSESMRPVRYFRDTGIELHLVDGVSQHDYLSFPSGHSASALAIFVVLALLVKNRWLAFVLLIVGFAVAFSRVYLSQHFMADIFAGSLIGCIAAFLSIVWVKRWKKPFLNQNVVSIFKQ
jgi:membrane-associated phospholipid phosphatase